jgi:hypothetical protein
MTAAQHRATLETAEHLHVLMTVAWTSAKERAEEAEANARGARTCAEAMAELVQLTRHLVSVLRDDGEPR